MDKQQKLKIALPVLLVIMAVVWGPIILGDAPKSNKGSGAPSLTGNDDRDDQTDMMDIVAMSSTGLRQKAKTSYEAWGQNPFVLTQPPQAIVVEGILWDPANPQVMINGNILGVGGSVDTNMVIEIKSDSVILETVTGETVELKMGEMGQF